MILATGALGKLTVGGPYNVNSHIYNFELLLSSAWNWNILLGQISKNGSTAESLMVHSSIAIAHWVVQTSEHFDLGWSSSQEQSDVPIIVLTKYPSFCVVITSVNSSHPKWPDVLSASRSPGQLYMPWAAQYQPEPPVRTIVHSSLTLFNSDTLITFSIFTLEAGLLSIASFFFSHGLRFASP
jgi:hypothetical protein